MDRVCVMFNRTSISLLVLLFGSSSAQAYTFVPTEPEWNTWTYRCKAIYAGTQVAKNSGFSRRIPAGEIAKWRQYATQKGGAWHYCAGLIHLSRGLREFEPASRQQHLKRALTEIDYTYQRLDKDDPWASEVGTSLGRVYRNMGRYDEAMEVLSGVINFHRNDAGGYFVAAMVYRDQQQLDKAKEILIKGNENTNSESAQLLYMLGLVSLELGEIENAKHYAEKAYELGYPLPGLRNRLKEYE